MLVACARLHSRMQACPVEVSLQAIVTAALANVESAEQHGATQPLEPAAVRLLSAEDTYACWEMLPDVWVRDANLLQFWCLLSQAAATSRQVHGYCSVTSQWAASST